MTKKYDAVIFDLDGTIIDSTWVWPKVTLEYLAKYQLEMPNDLDPALEGASFTDVAIYFKQRFKLPDSIEQIKEDWNSMATVFYTEHMQLKEGVLEFMQRLKGQGIRLGIATSNSIELTEAVLEYFNLKTYFEVICTSCMVDRGKPYPYIYQKVAEELNIDSSQCLVIEDGVNGVIAAQRAGMDVWAVRDRQSISTQQKLKDITNRYIESYKEVIKYF